jgi:hypothetical protein
VVYRCSTLEQSSINTPLPIAIRQSSRGALKTLLKIDAIEVSNRQPSLILIVVIYLAATPTNWTRLGTGPAAVRATALA